MNWALQVWHTTNRSVATRFEALLFFACMSIMILQTKLIKIK
jgi:hypothetical protein